MEILTMNDKYIKRLTISYFIISQAFPNRTSFYENNYKWEAWQMFPSECNETTAGFSRPGGFSGFEYTRFFLK